MELVLLTAVGVGGATVFGLFRDAETAESAARALGGVSTVFVSI